VPLELQTCVSKQLNHLWDTEDIDTSTLFLELDGYGIGMDVMGKHCVPNKANVELVDEIVFYNISHIDCIENYN